MMHIDQQKNIILTFLIIILFIPQITLALTVEVSTTTQLQAEISAANQRADQTTILLNNGIYKLSHGLSLSNPHITLRGKSNNPEKVIIEGDKMGPDATVGSIISITASDCTIENLTLQKCRWHLIQIHGENNADRTRISHCILKDSYEQMVKVTVNDKINTSSDDGVIEDCRFAYSAGIGPQWYIGGIDAHAAKNWIVRKNTFKSIISPSDRISEFAIHFWNHSADNLIEKNLIINCDRGIGFGLGNRGNSGGIIRNNMIYHALEQGKFADTGIALEESPGSQIYNNTIFMEHSYPSAIEYRFPATRNILIANNLTNKPIQARDGATGNLVANITSAQKSWFINVERGDLHLNSQNISTATKKGSPIPDLIDDFDGALRSTPPYKGADEVTARLNK